MSTPIHEYTSWKRLRKGTRSCCECRRRKVKCKFASPTDGICIPCQRRGSECVSQISDEPETDENGRPRKMASYSRPVEGEHGPQATIMHIAAASPTTTTPSSNRIQITSPPTAYTPPSTGPDPSTDPSTDLTSITQALLAALPSQQDIDILLVKINRIPTICYKATKPRIFLTTLFQPSTHPVTLARHILLFARALQYLPHSESILGLAEPHRVIQKRLAETAIQCTTKCDALLDSLELLENIVLEGLYHVDCGNLERAWLALRRGVTAAQLLGLPWPGRYRFKILHGENGLEPQSLWRSITSIERVLSLLLGLPTSAPVHMQVSTRELSDAALQSGTVHDFITRVAPGILERNQMPDSTASMQATCKINEELRRGSQMLPASFWPQLAFPDFNNDVSGTVRETNRACNQMCYFSLVIQLQLPLLLSATVTKHRAYARTACANAGREVLTREIVCRTFVPITLGCHMSDIMAMVGGVALVLSHILGSSVIGESDALAGQRMSDRAVVLRALELWRAVSEPHAHVFGAKCTVLLRVLLAIEGNVARVSTEGNGRSSNGTSQTVMVTETETCFIKTLHNGTFRVDANGVLVVPDDEVNQLLDSYDNVSVGGLGLIYFRQPPSAMSHGLVPDAESNASWSVLPLPDDGLVPPETVAETLVSVDVGIDDLFHGFDLAYFDMSAFAVGDPLDVQGIQSWEM